MTPFGRLCSSAVSLGVDCLSKSVVTQGVHNKRSLANVLARDLFGLSKVEMAGIEPASKEFGQRYTTSIVGQKGSRRPALNRQITWSTSRHVFGQQHRRRVGRSPN